jgi:hypothetical protein
MFVGDPLPLRTLKIAEELETAKEFEIAEELEIEAWTDATTIPNRIWHPSLRHVDQSCQGSVVRASTQQATRGHGAKSRTRHDRTTFLSCGFLVRWRSSTGGINHT